MNYKNYTIVSARCSSSRLPNKALLEINNELKSIERYELLYISVKQAYSGKIFR